MTLVLSFPKYIRALYLSADGFGKVDVVETYKYNSKTD